MFPFTVTTCTLVLRSESQTPSNNTRIMPPAVNLGGILEANPGTQQMHPRGEKKQTAHGTRKARRYQFQTLYLDTSESANETSRAKKKRFCEFYLASRASASSKKITAQRLPIALGNPRRLPRAESLLQFSAAENASLRASHASHWPRDNISAPLSVVSWT